MIAHCPPEPPAYYFKMVKPFRDSFGLITQKDASMDGGDAAHRTGVFYYGMYLNFEDSPKDLVQIKKNFLQDIAKLRRGPGKFIRHPDSSMWYSNPNNFSRDQATPLILALGAFNEQKEITNLLGNIITSFSFYPNRLKNWTNEEKKLPTDFRDIAAPADWGMFIRALKEESYYPLLYFTDWQLLGNAITRIVISYFDPHDTSDDINFSLLLFQARRIHPTFVSEWATWVYTRLRANSPFIHGRHSLMPVASAWDYYFEYVHIRPPLNKVYQCPLEKFYYQLSKDDH